ncbi:MAG: lysophospholipid acyltransferase family protein [Byssovorax sp.]
MSKKDKRKKHEPKRSPSSAWIADLRRGVPGAEAGEAAGDAENVTPLPPPAPPPAEPAASEASVPVIAPLRPLDSASFGLDRFPPGDEMGEDTLAEIAPVGPTEYAAVEAAFLRASSEGESVEQAPAAASVEQLEQQIRDLEARLDAMIAERPAAAPAAPASTPGAAVPPEDTVVDAVSARAPIPRAIAPAPKAPIAPAGVTAKEVLPSDFYLRQWGRAGMRKRLEEVDELGYDPTYEARYLPLLDFLCKRYFRVEAQGTANIPAEGRCLIVANHSGGPLPYDGLMLRAIVRREHPAARELRWLTEDFVYYLPFAGTVLNRLGAVRACQENAERLLAHGSLVAVFPEGEKGIGKLYRDRYRLQRFGRGGFVRLALRTGTPIIPSAIVGAEEANPMLFRIEYMAKTLGMPFLPITPTFPALGPLGLLPAPTKWKVAFGEPISFDGHGPEAAEDDILVGRLADRVRGAVQALLDRALESRRSVWFG